MKKIIDAYENDVTWRRKENANFNKSFAGEQAHIVNYIMARETLRSLPKRIAKAHNQGDIHIHNIDSGMKIPYCHGGSLLTLLMKGLKTRDITSKPAKHMGTVISHITNYFYMSQLEFSGAQALSDFDTLVAPFIYYDRLSYKNLKQDIQRLIYDLNYACRQAFQTPFTNLTFNLVCPEHLENTPIVIGGVVKERTYSEFNEESKLINKAFAEVLMDRDGAGNPLTFPIPTLNLTKRIDFSDPVFLNIIEEACELGSYYFMNYLGSGIDENSVKAMCCRLNIDLDELSSARGYWNMGDGTGSLGVVSLNMSRIGYQAKNESMLYEILDSRMELAKKQLLIKKKNIKRSIKKGLLPFSCQYGLNLDHYFCTIGLIGLNELVMNFTGDPLSSHVDLAYNIVHFMREKTREFQKNTGELFNLEMTPGEGSCYRLALMDRNKNHGIFYQGTRNAPFYTTLIVPPSEDIALGKRLQIEEKILPLFTGGTISRHYIGEAHPNPEVMVKFVERIAKKTRIPYFDLTATFSVCNDTGKKYSGLHDVCPDCKGKISQFSRVVGYYRPVEKYNVGKRQEFRERKYLSQIN